MRGIEIFLGGLKNKGGKAFRGPVTEGCYQCAITINKVINGWTVSFVLISLKKCFSMTVKNNPFGRKCVQNRESS